MPAPPVRMVCTMILAEPSAPLRDSQRHVVQFFQDESALYEQAGRFLWAGLLDAETVVIIAKPVHGDLLRQYLAERANRADRADAIRHVTVVDATVLLQRAMPGGYLDQPALLAALQPILAQARAASPSGRVRAYGELVDLLVARGQADAALALEHLWHDILHGDPAYSLWCGYTLDHFRGSHLAPSFLDICQVHTDLIAGDAHTARQSQVLQAGQVLASTTDLEATISRIAALPLPILGDFAILDVRRDDGTYRRVAVAHHDAKLQARLDEQPWDAWADPDLHRGAASSGSPGFFPERDEWLRPIATDPAQLRFWLSVGLQSVLTVPLAVGDRYLGALSLFFIRPDRRHDAADLLQAITLGRRAAQALETATLCHVLAEAVTARDRFLALASHELRTPMSTISLQAELVCLHLQNPLIPAASKAALLQKVAGIRRQADYLKRLVDTLMDASSVAPESWHMVKGEVDLAALVTEVVADMAVTTTLTGSPIHVQTCGPVVGSWDRLRLEQVVTNLLSNAVKFGQGKPIAVTMEADETEIRLQVQDHGIGIAAADQTRIFERFERAVPDRRFGGFGLGLFIASRIVRAMGGSLTCTSQLQEGSTFTVRLPIVAAEL